MTEWLTVRGAAAHAKCGVKSIYVAVSTGRLRAARLGGRRELRFVAEWVDAWLLASTTPQVVNASAPACGSTGGALRGLGQGTETGTKDHAHHNAGRR
jgi:excisionase family DNA binding protein